MKKVILFVFLLACQYSFSQVYYNDGDNDIILPTSRITGNKVGNVVGAYFTLGLSAANSNKIIEGDHSELEIDNKRPTFDIHFKNDNLNGYDMNNIVLVKVHKKKNSRNLRTGKYGLIAGVQNGVNQDDIIPINVEKENGVIVISPKSKLKKGEYCFYYVGQVPNDVDKANVVYDFMIK